MNPHPRLTQRILDAAEDVSLRRIDIEHVEYNPRQISKAAFKRLCDSVRKFGLVIKPVVNRRSQEQGFPHGSRMVIVGGNQRIDACDAVLETQDYRPKCSLVDVDATTERELCIALNNASMQGEWDLELLGETIASIHDDGGDIRDTGFSVNDLRIFMDDDSLGGIIEQRTEQESDEAETVDMLSMMRDAGEDERREQEKDDGDSDDDLGIAHDVDDDDSELDLFGDASSEGNKDTTQAIRDDLKAKRKKYREQQVESDSADFTIHLVFDSRQQMLRFIEYCEIDPAKRFVDGVDFARVVLDFDVRGHSNET